MKPFLSKRRTRGESERRKCKKKKNYARCTMKKKLGRKEKKRKEKHIIIRIDGKVVLKVRFMYNILSTPSSSFHLLHLLLLHLGRLKPFPPCRCGIYVSYRRGNGAHSTSHHITSHHSTHTHTLYLQYHVMTHKHNASQRRNH